MVRGGAINVPVCARQVDPSKSSSTKTMHASTTIFCGGMAATILCFKYANTKMKRTE
jgi:hypothetical protein